MNLRQYAAQAAQQPQEPQKAEKTYTPLHREQEAQRAENARSLEICKEYNATRAKSGQLTADILKGLNAGENPYILLMKAAECIGLLTGETRVFSQSVKDRITEIYGQGLTDSRALEIELAKIPGEIILMIDCCGSGGVLGEASDSSALLNGIGSAFSGAMSGSGTRSSKFKVIASARLDEDSHRIGFSEGTMTTVFARALCDAAGWSVDRSAPSSMSADTNYNGEITLDELDSYLSRRVKWYLSLAGDYDQNVCVYPQGDNSVIFERKE